ncbi:MAG: hypothetical protein OEZ39_07590 [Gammaproteobacteria bacterium]|nr:hypothetical protein [Gammaproteobacteria bacterium]MDH5651721.1 hypothetical protein [Gammaproteobacteria bacterium]
MSTTAIPVYEVEELSFEEAVLAVSSDEERYQADYRKSSERLLNSVPDSLLWPELCRRQAG